MHGFVKIGKHTGSKNSSGMSRLSYDPCDY